MRYQDWDILLYPKDCEVPFKEFKTTCYAVQEGGPANGNVPTVKPLLTCFVPGVLDGSAFSISLHSWTRPIHVGSLAMSGLGDRAMWQIKVMVDGETVATQVYPHTCSWPQAISTGTSTDRNGNTFVHDLTWPTWRKSAIAQRDWDAADSAGRIKVELAAGFKEQLGGKVVFTTLSTIVCFAFFPAPIAHLERVGIAWPNPKMFEKPLHSEGNLIGSDSNNAQGPGNVVHRRTYSNSNSSAPASSPMCGIPMPPPPTPALGHYDFHALQGSNMHGFHDTSMHGPTLTDAVSGHELQNIFGSVALPSLHEPYRGQRTQLEIRLPSDQLQKLIVAMSPSKQTETQSTSSTQMPPPPLPLHALVAKAGETDQHAHDGAKGADDAHDNVGLYNASRGSSDVSMHTGCTYFPSCTSVDDSGLVVHGNPACPSANVKGRKEGSSPMKPRDFLSTILGSHDNDTVSPVTDDTKSSISSDSPGETPGRKRTRAALKALNIHDGSPEKKDASARKPSRKVSRASSAGSKVAREAASRTLVKAGEDDDEDKENQMVMGI